MSTPPPGAAASDLERLLDSIRWTFDTYLLPAINDPLARSYARTVSVLLAQAQARVQHEPRALAEELADVRATLGGLAPALDDEQRKLARETLQQTGEAPPVVPLAQMQADIARLDALLAAAAPTLDGQAREQLQALLRRRFERRRRWMPDDPPRDSF